MRIWKPMLLGAVLMVGLGLAACAPSGSGNTPTPTNKNTSPASTPSTRTPAPTSKPATTSTPSTVSLTAEQQQAVDLSAANLATKLSVDRSKISLVKIEAVSWPDTSLGVPEPGKAYAQVIVPGYKV
ncbi:MAG: hypothetical protein HY662_01780, partial [Chloroflexi bacterium]|nr:hypothetical protein [Chloroflexota bacterium]